MKKAIDFLEDSIQQISPSLIATLMQDRTAERNIFWATHDYESRGKGYAYHDPIAFINVKIREM